MYCQQCGFHNNAERQVCCVCDAPLSSLPEADDRVLCVDLTRVPLVKILRTFQVVNPLLAVLSALIIVYTYVLKRLTRQPYLVPVMKSCFPKLHMSDMQSIKKLRKKSFDKVASFLGANGFEKMLDVENRSNVRETVTSIFINRNYRSYANVVMIKATGQISEISISAITASGKVIQFTNGFEPLVQDDRNVEHVSIPGAAVADLWRRFTDDPQRSAEQRLCPEPRFLFRILMMEFRRLLEIGIEQGFYHVGDARNGAVPAAVLMCAHHAASLAVRNCRICGTAMCEACYEEVCGEFYCTTCAAKPEITERLEKRLREPWGFAGLGVRLFATTIDILVVATGIGILYGLMRIASGLVLWRFSGAASFFIGQLVAVSFIVAYFIVPIVKSGGDTRKASVGFAGN